MATPSPNGRGKVPAKPAAQFKAANQGHVSEPTPQRAATHQQQKAANDVVREANKPKVDQAKLKTSKARLSYNVNALGTQSKQSSVEPKKQSALKPYTSKKNGTIYHTKQAIDAAKNLDQLAEKKRETEQAQLREKKITKHHAPAPKPKGVAANKYRGRSTTQEKATVSKESTPANDRQKLTAYQARVLAAAQKSYQRDQAKAKHQSQNKTQQRER